MVGMDSNINAHQCIRLLKMLTLKTSTANIKKHYSHQCQGGFSVEKSLIDCVGRRVSYVYDDTRGGCLMYINIELQTQNLAAESKGKVKELQ